MGAGAFWAIGFCSEICHPPSIRDSAALRDIFGSSASEGRRPSDVRLQYPLGPGAVGSERKPFYNTFMSWPGTGTSFWIAVFLFDLYAIARAVTRGHGVESTLAWIFAILAL